MIVILKAFYFFSFYFFLFTLLLFIFIINNFNILIYYYIIIYIYIYKSFIFLKNLIFFKKKEKKTKVGKSGRKKSSKNSWGDTRHLAIGRVPSYRYKSKKKKGEGT